MRKRVNYLFKLGYIFFSTLKFMFSLVFRFVLILSFSYNFCFSVFHFLRWIFLLICDGNILRDIFKDFILSRYVTSEWHYIWIRIRLILFFLFLFIRKCWWLKFSYNKKTSNKFWTYFILFCCTYLVSKSESVNITKFMILVDFVLVKNV